MIKLKNDIHATHATTSAPLTDLLQITFKDPDTWTPEEQATAQAIKNQLCNFKDCPCSPGVFGQHGPQKLTVLNHPRPTIDTLNTWGNLPLFDQEHDQNQEQNQDQKKENN